MPTRAACKKTWRACCAPHTSAEAAMRASEQSARFFRMALMAASLAFVAVIFNAYARLSEAGLGCPDWPGCYGMLFAPVTAQDLEQEPNPEKQKALEKKRAAQETLQRFISG